uniref:G-protein coupled receptors family 1 profile domain-containing protein n=1 Tax=Neogobius melanostomus TaxID=47308 RepID=A0A8C6WJS0_9GOBI
MTSNFTNISTSGHPPPSSSGVSRVAPAVFLSLCFLVGFPGNLAVIICKPNWQNLSSLNQSLMMNLALSDLLCLCTTPFWIYDEFTWTLGRVMCKIVSFLTCCSLYSSLLTVTALSVQRYMQVIHQQRCLMFKNGLLALLWLTSILLSVPALIFRQEMKYQQYSSCDQNYTYAEQEVVVLVTECFIVLSSYIIISCAYIFLNRKLNQAVLFNNASTSRLLTSIIVKCFVLWTPYFVFNVVSVVGILTKNVRIVHFYDFGFGLFSSITFINSCLNPLLYGFALGICHRNTNSNNAELNTAADT